MIELGKQISGQLAQGVDQHIQAAAVGHADHDFLHAFGTSHLDELVHRGDKAFSALKREALLTNKLGVQKPLKTLGGCESLQNVFFLVGIEIRFAANEL